MADDFREVISKAKTDDAALKQGLFHDMRQLEKRIMARLDAIEAKIDALNKSKAK